MTQMMKYEGLDGTQKNRVLVAVRFRPLRCAPPMSGGSAARACCSLACATAPAQ